MGRTHHRKGVRHGEEAGGDRERIRAAVQYDNQAHLPVRTGAVLQDGWRETVHKTGVPGGGDRPGSGYYLVRAASPDGFDDSTGVMSIANYDPAWDVLLDNKEIRLGAGTQYPADQRR